MRHLSLPAWQQPTASPASLVTDRAHAPGAPLNPDAVTPEQQAGSTSAQTTRLEGGWERSPPSSWPAIISAPTLRTTRMLQEGPTASHHVHLLKSLCRRMASLVHRNSNTPHASVASLTWMMTHRMRLLALFLLTFPNSNATGCVCDLHDTTI